MRNLLKLLLFLPLLAFAQPKEGVSPTPAETNKQLFDRTIDELNFRTFETVYDKHFTRQKFPENLRTSAARRQFSNFENNTELQKLFLNYNGVAERFKTRFGNGPLTQAEFEKQLNEVLRDRNFEFFIRGLPRDEKSALVRSEQRVIKQATARFNASASPTARPAPEPEEPLAAAAPLTTNGPAPGDEASPSAAPPEPEIRPTAAVVAETTSASPGWVGYLTLLLSLGSVALLLYIAADLLPELRSLRRRVRTLEAEQAYYPEPTAGEDDNLDVPASQAPPTAQDPGFFSRFRPQSTGELPSDNYDDDSH